MLEEELHSQPDTLESQATAEIAEPHLLEDGPLRLAETRRVTLSTGDRHHLWTFPNNGIDNPNAVGWRKPVWRTGGSQKPVPPHLPRKRISSSDAKGIIVGVHDRQP
jgi:hypothetical protein